MFKTVGTPKEDAANVKKPSDIAAMESSDATTPAVEGKQDGGESDIVEEFKKLSDAVVASTRDFDSNTAKKLEDLQEKIVQSSKNKRSVEGRNDTAEFIRGKDA